MKYIVGRFIGGPADKVVRVLPQRYSIFRFPVRREISITAKPEDVPELLPIKAAEYICLEDVNEVGQHVYLYVGTK